jgi:hypothetical protein
MSKTTVSLVVIMTIIAFTSGPQAYGTEPGPEMLQEISQQGQIDPVHTHKNDACVMLIKPEAPAKFGMPAPLQTSDALPLQTRLACSGQ